MVIIRKHTILLFFILSLLVFTGCSKEYSYENSPGNLPVSDSTQRGDTTKPKDTISPGPIHFPLCTSCIENSEPKMSEWSFKADNQLLCGRIDTAIMLGLERNTFTFFGPSACAGDTGLIFTVSLDPANPLDHDLTNLTASNAIFYYYHTYNPYILVSQTNNSFNLIISSYNHSTKIATGTFSGIAFTQDGRGVPLTSGNFKIKLL